MEVEMRTETARRRQIGAAYGAGRGFSYTAAIHQSYHPTLTKLGVSTPNAFLCNSQPKSANLLKVSPTVTVKLAF